MEKLQSEKLGLDMDGIRVDSGHPTETDSSVDDTEVQDETLDTESLLELRLTSTKGYGLFAIRDIPRGTCVVEDEALITVPATASKNKPERAVHIIQALQQLTHDQLDDYNGLHYNVKSIDSSMRGAIRSHFLTKQYAGDALEVAVKENVKMAAIFNTNCVAMGEDGKLGSGISLHYSRCNHSCTPNVENCFNTVTKCEMLHAVRDIKEGEEITPTYIDRLYRSTEERHDALRRWEFECECEACKGQNAMKSVKRRRRMAEINMVFDRLDGKPTALGWSVRTPKSATERVELAEELVQLSREEELEGMELVRAYHLCSKYSLEAGRCLKAVEYARLQVEVEQTCIGTVMQLPNSAAAWLRQLEDMEEKNDRRFRAERKRMQKESEKVRQKEERKLARQAEKEELLRKRKEEERAEALRVAEHERMRREREASEKAAREEVRRGKEAAKTAAKKTRRVVRASAEQVGIAAAEVDRVVTGMNGEDAVALAERLQGMSEEGEIRAALQGKLERMS